MDTFQDHDMGNPQQRAPSQGHRASSLHHAAVPHKVHYSYTPTPGQHVPYINPATELPYLGPGLVQYGHPAFPYSAHPYMFGTPMPPRPMAPPTYDPPPRNSFVDPEQLTEGEERRRQRLVSPSLGQLRDEAHRSCPHTDPLEDQIARLQEENENLRHECLTQRHEIDRIWLKRDQLRELLNEIPTYHREAPRQPPPREEYWGGYHPYPRLSMVTRDRQEGSIGPVIRLQCLYG